MNWLDLGIIIFLIIFVIVGIKRGLINSVLANFSLGVNCLISFFLCRPVKYIIGHWFKLSSTLYNHYMVGFEGLEQNANLTANLMTVPEESLRSTVDLAINEGQLSFIPKTMFKLFLNKRNLYETLHTADPMPESRTVAEIISQAYSNFFVTLIAFAITLTVVFVTVKLCQLLVKKLRTIGFVKVVDNSLGALYGVFRCFIVLIVICTIIKFMSSFSFMTGVINYINSSLFGQFIYAQINDFVDNYLSFSDVIASIFGN